MVAVIGVTISFALTTLFLLLVITERKRGVRFFENQRKNMDRFISRGAYILSHIDFSSLFSSMGKHISITLAHQFAHLSLVVVRFLERALTRTVRYLRVRRDPEMKQSLSVSPLHLLARIGAYAKRVGKKRPSELPSTTSTEEEKR